MRKMKKWLSRIFWIPVLILTVLFLVANRQRVAISLDPFSMDNPAVTTEALPLWFWLMLMLFIGVGVGAVGMWLSGTGRRHTARLEHRELKSLRRQAAAEKAAAAAKEVGVAEETPPLLETSPS